jgi:hypothetical protein
LLQWENEAGFDFLHAAGPPAEPDWSSLRLIVAIVASRRESQPPATNPRAGQRADILVAVVPQQAARPNAPVLPKSGRSFKWIGGGIFHTLGLVALPNSG